MSNYFRLLADTSVQDLWFLGEPVQQDGVSVDARRFTSCEAYGDTGQVLQLPMRRPGRLARFSFGAFDLPVVDRDLGNTLSACAPGGVELVPAVADETADLVIANVLHCVECIDDDQTLGEKWTERDGRPDRIGEYRTIVRLMLDRSRISHHLFRVRGWEIALIVSEALAMEARLDDVEGLRLQPVTSGGG